MAESSIFWPTSGVGDGAAQYSSDQLTTWLRAMLLGDDTLEGVHYGVGNELEVTNPAGLTIRTADGSGNVYGFPYFNTANVDYALVLPVIGVTGWRLVLRVTWAAQTVRVFLNQSADGVPAAPAVVQNPGVTWDISLAHGTVDLVGLISIVDDRAFCQYGLQVTPDRIENRMRHVWIPALGCWNQTLGINVDIQHAYGFPLANPFYARIYTMFFVPPDFASNASILAVTYPLAAGNQYCNLTVYQGADNEVYNTHTDTTGFLAQANHGANLYFHCFNLALPNLSPGDALAIDFIRDATHILDTSNNNVYCGGFIFSYLADS